MSNRDKIDPFHDLITDWLHRVAALRNPGAQRPAPKPERARDASLPVIRGKGHLRLVHSR
jgi:hypothetical protein